MHFNVATETFIHVYIPEKTCVYMCVHESVSWRQYNRYSMNFVLCNNILYLYYMHRTTRNFRQQNTFANFTTCSHWWNFYRQILYIEYWDYFPSHNTHWYSIHVFCPVFIKICMVTFTIILLAKIDVTEYFSFCNTKVGLVKFLSSENFWLYGITYVPLTYLLMNLSLTWR